MGERSVSVWFKAVLHWAQTCVYEQLCLLEIFKLAVSFLVDVFDLGERLCSRSMSTHSQCLRCFQRRMWEQASDWLNSFVTEEKEGRSTWLRFEQLIEPIVVHFVHWRVGRI